MCWWGRPGFFVLRANADVYELDYDRNIARIKLFHGKHVSLFNIGRFHVGKRPERERERWNMDKDHPPKGIG